MKKYIANNWMKILRIGGYVALILIALYKINAPKTLIPDYIKYGKDIAPSAGEGSAGSFISGIFGDAYAEMNAISPELVGLVGILMAAILGIVFIHAIIDKKPDAKKKK